MYIWFRLLVFEKVITKESVRLTGQHAAELIFANNKYIFRFYIK